MKVLLISANRTEINMRTMPLGLACVAQALTRAGHAVKMLDLVQVADVQFAVSFAIEEFAPEVVGISIRNIDDQNKEKTTFLFQEDNEIISMVRRLTGAPIVLGGAGYSLFPEAILAASEADIGIEGEGETVLNTVLERLKDRGPFADLPGVHVKGGGFMTERVLIRNPDALPLPDPDLLLAGAGDTEDVWIPVQTRRGCPMRCSYCSTGAIEGTITRRRSPGMVVEWIERLAGRGIKQVYFVDNTFNLPPSYAGALCRELVRVKMGLKWRCILYPYRLDEHLVETMAEAGCVEASIGFESGNDRVLKVMNKRFRREDVVKACSLLKRYGIRRMGFLLLGGPGETFESVKESLAFADGLNLEMMRVTVGIRIYPGTELAAQALKEGIIGPDDDLLIPQFYIMPGLDEGWIREAVLKYGATRQNWII